MQQPSLFDDAWRVTEPTVGRHRHDDPDTSKQAAQAVLVRSGTQRSRVLEHLVLRGDFGATDCELSRLLGIPRSSAATRRKELTEAGLVAATEVTRFTIYDQAAIVHRATAAGVEAWRILQGGR